MLKKLQQQFDDLHTRNASAYSRLRGGAFCLSIERLPDGEPWVQAKTGALNLFYPHPDDPLSRLQSSEILLPENLTCPDWKPHKYATFEFDDPGSEGMSQFIHELFRSFYNSPDDNSYSIEIF
ncbi:MAG: hypothetical protein KDA84_21305, partial [Planctomycetaceae bacterium]|nr:hypothetical protein [Planctomycetaceae bacterium]